MQLAARSYLAAGVALVGASAIAVSPMAPSTPQVHLPVALTAAVDNPLTVFAPVATATQDLIGYVIERQTTNPAPILHQLADNAVAGYQAYLSTPPVWAIAQVLAGGVIAAQEFGPNVTNVRDTTSEAVTTLASLLNQLGAGLPAALQAAGELIAAGEPNAAIDAIVGAGFLPITSILSTVLLPEINAVGQLVGVPQPILDAAGNAVIGAGLALAMATVGIGFDLPGPQPLVKQFITGVQAVTAGAASGDPGTFVNAVQHSVADFTASVVGQTQQAISMADNLTDVYVDALKQIAPKPFTPPEEPFTTANALAAPAPAAIEVSTLQTEKTSSTSVANADNVSGSDADNAAAPKADAVGGAADIDSAAAAGASEGETAGKTVTKLSTTASPKAKVDSAKPAKVVRDQVKSAVKKMTSGLKKDKAGAQKGAAKKAASHHSAKGGDSK